MGENKNNGWLAAPKIFFFVSARNFLETIAIKPHEQMLDGSVGNKRQWWRKMTKSIFVVDHPFQQVKVMTVNEDGEICSSTGDHLYDLSEDGDEVSTSIDYARAFPHVAFYERKLDDASGDKPFFSLSQERAQSFVDFKQACLREINDAGLDDTAAAIKRQNVIDALRTRFGF